MKVSVASLNHHPRNMEIYDLSNIDDLVQSIDEVGLLSPLVIDQFHQVISGNRRLAAIRKLGWKEVDVEVADIPNEDVVGILIHHNKQRVKSTREILNEYAALEKIHGVGQGRRTDLDTSGKSTKGTVARDIIAEKIGVSSSQMGRLLFIQKTNPDFAGHVDAGTLTINQAYTALKKRIADTSIISTKSGSSSTVEADGYTFHHKSSHRMDEVDDESVQMVMTSPPYYQQRKYSDGNEVLLGHEDTPEEYVSNLVSHLDDVKRVLRKDGSFFLVLGDKFQDMNQLNLPHRVAIGLQDKGWIQRNCIIWRKTNSKPSSSKSNLQQTFEFIFHFTKTRKYLYQPTRIPTGGGWNAPKLGEIQRHKNLHGIEKVDFMVQRKVGRNNLQQGKPDPAYFPYLGDEKKNLGDFWTEDVVETAAANRNRHAGLKSHPAPFPHKLVVVPLLQTTREDDLVCDPFHGSGTVGDVATAYGRRYVGYDVKVY
jgi:DNA modification methylase